MTAISLGHKGVEYLFSAFDNAGGLASVIDRSFVNSPVIFAPERMTAASFENLDAGCVTTQSQADLELARYLELQKRNDFTLCSILFHDPWIEVGDLEGHEPPQEIVLIDNGVYYLHEVRGTSPGLIKEYRSVCISFLRIIYVSAMSTAALRERIERGDKDSYVRSIKHSVVNACDDETWIACRLSKPK